MVGPIFSCALQYEGNKPDVQRREKFFTALHSDDDVRDVSCNLSATYPERPNEWLTTWKCWVTKSNGGVVDFCTSVKIIYTGFICIGYASKIYESFIEGVDVRPGEAF